MKEMKVEERRNMKNIKLAEKKERSEEVKKGETWRERR